MLGGGSAEPVKQNVHDKTVRIYFGKVLHKPQTDPRLKNRKRENPTQASKQKTQLCC